MNTSNNQSHRVDNLLVWDTYTMHYLLVGKMWPRDHLSVNFWFTVKYEKVTFSIYSLIIPFDVHCSVWCSLHMFSHSYTFYFFKLYLILKAITRFSMLAESLIDRPLLSKGVGAMQATLRNGSHRIK